MAFLLIVFYVFLFIVGSTLFIAFVFSGFKIDKVHGTVLLIIILIFTLTFLGLLVIGAEETTAAPVFETKAQKRARLTAMGNAMANEPVNLNPTDTPSDLTCSETKQILEAYNNEFAQHHRTPQETLLIVWNHYGGRATVRKIAYIDWADISIKKGYEHKADEMLEEFNERIYKCTKQGNF